MSDSPDADRQIGVQAVETGMMVLGALPASPELMRIIDIASEANMSPAKIHRYLVFVARKLFAELGYRETCK